MRKPRRVCSWNKSRRHRVLEGGSVAVAAAAPEAGAVEVMAVLRAREAAGTIKLVPKPAGK
jgi:hypothetical protein